MMMHLMFSTEILGHVIFPPQGQRSCHHRSRKTTHPPGQCHFKTNQRQQMDLEFPSQNRLDGLTITKISKNQSLCFQQNLHLLALNPLFPVQRHLSPSKSFSVTVIKDTNRQTLDCLIEHLEEEELKVNTKILSGWIVWWSSTFPCGAYPDLNIVRQWLINKLDDEMQEVMLADGGYNDIGEYFIMPSG